MPVRHHRSLPARRAWSLPAVLCLLAIAAAPALAIVPHQGAGPLAEKAFSSDILQARPVLVPYEQAAELDSTARSAWTAFRGAHGQWTAVIDRRSGTLEVAEGEGVPLVPGHGNRLTLADIAVHLGGHPEVDLATLDRAARAFLAEVAPLIGVDPSTLSLHPGRSGRPADHLWFVDYDLVLDGRAVEGARVVFRINHGNLIQFGAENLPSPGTAAPRQRVTREQARAAVDSYIGGFTGAEEIVDDGSLHLLPAAVADGRFAEGFAPGRGRGLLLVWELTFRRPKETGTWRARVDAVSGEVIELVDINHYAQVTGGAKVLGTSVNLPMPFANLSTGGFTNSAGFFSHAGGAVSTTLNGDFVRIVDTCGAIAGSGDPDGNIALGTSGGTDCTTPGSGGAGNTHSARTQFYHVNRAKEVGRGWLPANAWLNAQLTANVNLNQTCNAYWNGSSINFFRAGGSCGNTGEIEAVSLHEYGHGLDSNDGNGSGNHDPGTGETYGDWTAALATHDSCIGAGFRVTNCGGYGNTCTSCTGVRDIDWAQHLNNTPSNVDSFTRLICPFPSPFNPNYVGPCGKEGHCESYVSSEALWDFVNRDLPNPGSGTAWSIADRLWYLSRSTATAAFACTTGATYTSNGCNAGSLWKTMRAVDDDNGNLADGTPNSAELYAAFNRHLIACTSDAGANVSFRGCTQPAAPTLSLLAGDNQATASWTSTSDVYDVYRNEAGCDAGFTKIANDVTSPLVDTEVANSFTYYYQVSAHPTGNEACASPPSSCLSVTPEPPACTPPGIPGNVVATSAGLDQVDVSWDSVATATSYRVYRSATPGGPYTLQAIETDTSFEDSGLACGQTFYYVVRAATSATCQSADSAEATGSTLACPPCANQALYSNGFETGSGLADWTTGTFGGSGSTANWRGIQTCAAHGGTKIFRFGGVGCTDDYGDDVFNFAQPNGASGIAVPPASQNARLTFWHRRAFEAGGWDGGTLAVSVDGVDYTPVPPAAVLSGGYSGGITTGCSPDGSAGISSFLNTSASFTETVIDLDAACNAASGGTGGCSGLPVRIAFTTITDCNTTNDGWFLDDVSVSACVPLIPTDYYTVPPCRLVDTRNPNGPLGGPALGSLASRVFALAGSCGVPATAKALTVNVTAVNAGVAGSLTLYPADLGTAPLVSTINFVPGVTRANNAIVSLSAAGELTVKNNAAGSVHFVLDVTGWFE